MTWTILETTYKDKRKHYKVKCDCGYIGLRESRNVDSGRSTKCKSCSARLTAKIHGMPSGFKGIGGLSYTHYSSIKHGSERRDIPFNVSIDFLWELYLQQDRKCALTGLEITLVPAIKNSNVDWNIITASLDRIDSSYGYEENNVQWVHKEINRFKNNYSMEDFVTMCYLVVHHVNPEPSSLNGKIVSEKVQRLMGEEPTNNPDTSAQPLIGG